MTTSRVLLPTVETNPEVSALIDTLHRTSQRLEDLTAGEVDSVADSGGRTFLLQRAQEQLRQSEATRQAAILDALPAHVALLDNDGVIVAVNMAWRRFAASNALRGSNDGVGANYLHLCDRALGNCANEATQAASGIRAVLDGSLPHFSLEYPCHSPTEQRWFLMTVSPLNEVARAGAVVMHVDISERKLAENELMRLAGAMNATADAIYLVDRASMRFVHVNDSACRMLQQTREEVLALGPAAVLSMSTADLARAYDDIIASDLPSMPLEMLRTRKDGSQMWIELRRQAQHTQDGWLLITIVRDITARKKIDDTLLESDRRFSDMMDNVDLMSIVIDEQSRIIYCNEYFLRLTGWRREELIGEKFVDRIIPADLAANMREVHAEMLAGQAAARHHENDILTRNSERRRIRWNNSVLRSPEGMAIGTASIGEDITDRTIAENALRTSELQQRTLVEQLEQKRFRLVEAQRVAKIGSWETDLAAMTVIWSAETHRIFETDATNFLPTHQAFLGRVHPEDRALVSQAFERSLVDRAAPRTIEHRLLLPDGRVKYLEERWQVHFSASDEATNVVGTCQDITERKLREIALRNSEEKFNQLADNISDAFWIRSPDLSEVHYVSPAFEKIWGRTVASLRANPQRWQNFVHPEDKERVTNAFATLANQAVSLDIEYRIIRPDGEVRWVRVRGFPIRDDTGKVIRLAGVVSDITSSRQFQKALHRQNAELRVLFDLMPAMIWYKDTKNRILRVNQRAADGVGKSIAEIEGKASIEIYPNDAARFYADDLDVIESGLPKLGIVETIPAADGTKRWIQTDKVPFFDQSKEVAGIVVMAQDITERIEAAASLRSSLADFRSLAESMPQIVWITRPDGWNIYLNQQWVDYTGLTLEESMGDGWTKPFHPDDRQRASEAWLEATTKTHTYEIECRLRRADGAYRWWLIRGVPLRDDAGTILKWFGTCTDIHEIRVAEEEIAQTSLALRESERRFSDLLRNVDLASVMLDNEARIIFCNDYLLRLTGWKYEEVIGRNWFEVFAPSQSTEGSASSTQLLKSQTGQWNREGRIVTRSGEYRLMRWNSSVLRSGSGAVIGSASIGEDITDRQRAEAEILRLNVDLEHRVEARTAELQAANQELQAFDYSVSHDLKEPIRHVEGFSNMLLEDYGAKLDDNGRRCVQRIQDAARHMDQLVGDLLTLSMVSRGDVIRVELDLSALVKQVWIDLEQADPRPDRDFVIAPCRTAYADAGLLRIVLENLIGNARKFSSKRSRARIEFGCTQADGETVYFVRDNGAGFDSAYADKLFAPFQRLHSQGEFKGTGIGLATVRRIITRHGGRIWAEGAVNQGATFHFTLPS